MCECFDVALAARTTQQPVLYCTFRDLWTCLRVGVGRAMQLRPLCLPGASAGEYPPAQHQNINNSERAIAFGEAKRKLTADCRRCIYRFACHGGCQRIALPVSPSMHLRIITCVRAITFFPARYAVYECLARELLAQRHIRWHPIMRWLAQDA